ncbi:MAG: S8 family serine peptidase [Deltaproteobacteria bacterium]|nr:S8 family serine peptidase [Deltaproteobacteria bacterium]
MHSTLQLIQSVKKHFGKNFARINIFAIISCIATLGLIGSNVEAASRKISPRLAKVLGETQNPVPVIVMLKQLPLLPTTLLGQTRISDRERMIKQETLRRQSALRETVNELVNMAGVTGDAAISRYKFFWTVNAMMATAPSDTIMNLSDREDVEYITLDTRIRLTPDARQEAEVEGDAFTYGLERIGVPELRQAHPEMTGKGVNVAIIDTGIDAAHPEFKGKNIIFKDFVGTKKEAYDDNGHGTHVAGTISGIGAGGTQLGIAPQVNLIIAKVFTSGGSASLSSILRAMEWVANPDGDANTKMRPRVVNNSWGGSIGDDASKDPFMPAVLTWTQLEIFPSFAAGNEGPGTSTIGSPGGLPPAFAVGATDSSDGIARFSSRGPVKMIVNGKQVTYVKPDVSAPGHEVFSAMPGGKYAKMSGTSMATPHNTGAIALLVQAHPQLTVKQIREVMMKSAEPLGEKEMNNTFGAGRINIARGVELSASLF